VASIALGGALPVDADGGGLSLAHPGMYGQFTSIEAVEQLHSNVAPAVGVVNLT